MTLGGRRVKVDRPRVRSADDERELPLATYGHFADRDPLTRAVMDRMLAGVSTRRFADVGEPGVAVSAEVSLQDLAVGRAVEDRPPLLELDQSEHPIRMAVLTEPIRHQAGSVEVPTGPGLGIEIDRAAMAKFLTD